jgi:hypothetical protein
MLGELPSPPRPSDKQTWRGFPNVGTARQAFEKAQSRHTADAINFTHKYCVVVSEHETGGETFALKKRKEKRKKSAEATVMNSSSAGKASLESSMESN